MQTQTIINGITIVYEHPWLLVNGRQLTPDEVVALAAFFQSPAGRAVADELRAAHTSSGQRERAAGR